MTMRKILAMTVVALFGLMLASCASAPTPGDGYYTEEVHGDHDGKGASAGDPGSNDGASDSGSGGGDDANSDGPGKSGDGGKGKGKDGNPGKGGKGGGPGGGGAGNGNGKN